jgi:hypothetical protein
MVSAATQRSFFKPERSPNEKRAIGFEWRGTLLHAAPPIDPARDCSMHGRAQWKACRCVGHEDCRLRIETKAKLSVKFILFTLSIVGLHQPEQTERHEMFGTT